MPQRYENCEDVMFQAENMILPASRYRFSQHRATYHPAITAAGFPLFGMAYSIESASSMYLMIRRHFEA